MKRWFFYFLKRAIQHRKGRFIISSFSVLLTISVLTALMIISTGVSQNLGRQLSAYGFNMVVSPQRGETIDPEIANQAGHLSEKIRNVDYHVYGGIKIKGMLVDIMGIDISKMQGMKIQGAKPVNENEVMVGRRLSEGLNIKLEDTLSVEGLDARLLVKGIFEKGTDEDSMIIMKREDAQRLLGVEGVSAILLNVNPSEIEHIKRLIKERFPFLRVKTIRQIAMAEKKLLRKIKLLMILVTIVVLFSSAVSLGSTMGANVIERMEEIGIMKAIGAKRSDVQRIFTYEALFEGITGTAVGVLTGILMAEAISLSAFNSYASVNPLSLLPPLLAGPLLSVIATYLPVKDAMKASPSVILRGE